jgi:tRNA 2-selenouridine synthase
VRLFQPDRIHPREEAHPIMLDNVWPELRKLLAVSVHVIPAADAMARLDSFSAVIDARSEDEFALDHLPGAVNWPSLNNEERKRVGTMYVQVSPFEAQKHGAALVAANIARHIERHVLDKPKNWQPLVYCWRGGKRSGSLALVLGQIGFKVTLVEGGYKAFRGAVLADMPRLAQQFSFRVVCGLTGSGKTRLLQALEDAGGAGAGPGGAGQPPQLGARPASGAAAAFAKAV